MKFKIGDEVYLREGSRWNNGSISNPLGVVGTINEHNYEDCGVIWSNGHHNSAYTEDDLMLATEDTSEDSFRLLTEIENTDPLVEILQSEYDSLIEEINLLQQLLAEANQKLAGLEFKPISEYTLEDWEQARDKKWVFELYNGTEVFVQGIMDEFNDSSHPVELSTMLNKLHKCTVTVEGFMWYDEPKNDKSVKRRIK